MIRIPPTLLWQPTWLAILWCPLHAANESAGAPRIAANGRSMDVCVAGLGTIPCRWAATIENAGTVTRLDSGASGQDLQPAVHGRIADGITVVIASPETAAGIVIPGEARRRNRRVRPSGCAQYRPGIIHARRHHSGAGPGSDRKAGRLAAHRPASADTGARPAARPRRAGRDSRIRYVLSAGNSSM